MSQPDAAARLKAARIEAGHRSAAKAAVHHQWNVITYRSHESGERNFDIPTAIAYATAFGVAPEWIAFGAGAPPTPVSYDDLLDGWDGLYRAAQSMLSARPDRMSEAAASLESALAGMRTIIHDRFVARPVDRPARSAGLTSRTSPRPE